MPTSRAQQVGSPPPTGGPLPVPVTVLDTLGAAGTGTAFGPAGNHSWAIEHGLQYLGPRFMLAQPTTITEIGAYLYGFLEVEVRPALPDGRPNPDPGSALGAFPLSCPLCGLAESRYASASLALPLGRGTYFAILRPLPGAFGALLLRAEVPFPFTPPTVTIGILRDGTSWTEEAEAAVRILGLQP